MNYLPQTSERWLQAALTIAGCKRSSARGFDFVSTIRCFSGWLPRAFIIETVYIVDIQEHACLNELQLHTHLCEKQTATYMISYTTAICKNKVAGNQLQSNSS
jgi:hypothetical protein